MHRRLLLLASAIAVTSFGACYEGGDLEDKEPPPGYAGGFCVAPDATCNAGLVCYEDSICYDPQKPCSGVFCGGHGVCYVDNDEGAPGCMCDPGYANVEFTHFCLPE